MMQYQSRKAKFKYINKQSKTGKRKLYGLGIDGKTIKKSKEMITIETRMMLTFGWGWEDCDGEHTLNGLLRYWKCSVSLPEW